jgi:tetratricopeptide (TPR) repeat protein
MDSLESKAHPVRMRSIRRIAIMMLLASTRFLAQGNPHDWLHDALVQEQQGRFDLAINLAKLAVSSHQLTGVELGRGYVMLGVAYHQTGKFAEAKAALESSLSILRHDPEHMSDYAAALNNYGGLCGDLGQLEVAEAMWLKALHFRKQTGDHAAAMRSLTNLAQLALARRRIHDAKKYVKQAFGEMKLVPDPMGDDLVLLVETQASLALGEGQSSAALAGFQRALELCRQTRGDDYWLTGWEHMLRGKAYAQLGDINRALADMREGLAILEQALGRRNAMYLGAQMAYSQILDRAGLHAEALQLRAASAQASKDLVGRECFECTINVVGFR